MSALSPWSADAPQSTPQPTPGHWTGWQRLAWVGALLLPVLLAVAVQQLQPPAATTQVLVLNEARAWLSNAATPPAELAQAPRQPLPLTRAPAEAGASALWLAIDLPAGTGQVQSLALSSRPAAAVFLDGEPLTRDLPVGSGPRETLLLGQQHQILDLPPGLRRGSVHTLQLRLAAPGPSGAVLAAPLLGPPQAVQALDHN